MCVCVYVCMYVCMYCMHACMHKYAFMYVCIGRRGQTSQDSERRVYMNVCMYVCIVCMHKYAFMYVCMYRTSRSDNAGFRAQGLYVCMYVCMYVSLCVRLAWKCCTALPAYEDPSQYFTNTVFQLCIIGFSSGLPPYIHDIHTCIHTHT
jgi:hypothetical protein